MALKIGNGLDLQNRPIINVSDPGSAQEAATKNYVDGAIRGLDWKQEVIAGSTGNVSLTAPGTTLDGVALTNPMRIVLKDQTVPAENGVYDWTGAAVTLTRSLDADSGFKLSGSTVTVQRGTVNGDRVYRVITDDAITLGTTGITFAQVGAGGTPYTAGNGLVLSGADFNIGSGSGILVTADAIAVDYSTVARKLTGTIGNGSLTVVPFVHGLGYRLVTVCLYLTATFEAVLCDYVLTDINTVTFTFATAPATGAYTVVVVG